MQGGIRVQNTVAPLSILIQIQLYTIKVCTYHTYMAAGYALAWRRAAQHNMSQVNYAWHKLGYCLLGGAWPVAASVVASGAA